MIVNEKKTLFGILTGYIILYCPTALCVCVFVLGVEIDAIYQIGPRPASTSQSSMSIKGLQCFIVWPVIVV